MAARPEHLERLAGDGAARRPDAARTRRLAASTSFVFSPNYKISSLLRFHLPGQPRTYAQDIYGARALQFDHFPLNSDLKGATGILVLSDQAQSRLDLDRVRPYFDTLEKVDTIETRAFGRITRRVEIYRGSGYKGHPRLDGLLRARPATTPTTTANKHHAATVASSCPPSTSEGNVTELRDRVAAALPDVDWELIFVDDDSPDGTAERAGGAGAAGPARALHAAHRPPRAVLGLHRRPAGGLVAAGRRDRRRPAARRDAAGSRCSSCCAIRQTRRRRRQPLRRAGQHRRLGPLARADQPLGDAACRARCSRPSCATR